jgi:hypothetical protein
VIGKGHVEKRDRKIRGQDDRSHGHAEQDHQAARVPAGFFLALEEAHPRGHVPSPRVQLPVDHRNSILADPIT